MLLTLGASIWSALILRTTALLPAERGGVRHQDKALRLSILLLLLLLTGIALMSTGCTADWEPETPAGDDRPAVEVPEGTVPYSAFGMAPPLDDEEIEAMLGGRGLGPEVLSYRSLAMGPMSGLLVLDTAGLDASQETFRVPVVYLERLGEHLSSSVPSIRITDPDGAGLPILDGNFVLVPLGTLVRISGDVALWERSEIRSGVVFRLDRHGLVPDTLSAEAHAASGADTRF